jgi:hypothetical protein
MDAARRPPCSDYLPRRKRSVVHDRSRGDSRGELHSDRAGKDAVMAGPLSSIAGGKEPGSQERKEEQGREQDGPSPPACSGRVRREGIEG